MHHVLEIVMPQVENVEEAVTEIMLPFDENGEDEDYDGRANPDAFWDFWVIGGRWAGSKLEAGLDKEKLAKFYEVMQEREVIISSFTCGKQEISPASQIPMVDALWTEFFPEYNGRACPLFKHANDQYANDCLYGDVMRLKDVPVAVESGSVIIANYNIDDTKLEAISMFSDSIWNGVNFEKTIWDGTLKHALELHDKQIAKFFTLDYRNKNIPNGDWIVVTVDYHS